LRKMLIGWAAEHSMYSDRAIMNVANLKSARLP
jgi:hypothetical protein